MPDWITCEAYSHEVSSCGFWPGGGENEALFYSYTYPVPKGFPEEPVQPDAGVYSKDMGEFILPYNAIRQSPSPDADLLAFFQSTFDAATNRANWDTEALEWDGPDRFEPIRAAPNSTSRVKGPFFELR